MGFLLEGETERVCSMQYAVCSYATRLLKLFCTRNLNYTQQNSDVRRRTSDESVESRVTQYERLVAAVAWKWRVVVIQMHEMLRRVLRDSGL